MGQVKDELDWEMKDRIKGADRIREQRELSRAMIHASKILT